MFFFIKKNLKEVCGNSSYCLYTKNPSIGNYYFHILVKHLKISWYFTKSTNKHLILFLFSGQLELLRKINNLGIKSFKN